MYKNAILALAIGWSILIALLCLVSFNKLPSLGVSGQDKYVHFIFYFVFMLLWGYFSFLKHHKIIRNKIVSFFFISIIYGVVIEFLQGVVTTTRHADVFDVLANIIGTTVAFLVFVILIKVKAESKTAQK